MNKIELTCQEALVKANQFVKSFDPDTDIQMAEILHKHFDGLGHGPWWTDMLTRCVMQGYYIKVLTDKEENEIPSTEATSKPASQTS